MISLSLWFGTLELQGERKWLSTKVLGHQDAFADFVELFFQVTLFSFFSEPLGYDKLHANEEAVTGAS